MGLETAPTHALQVNPAALIGKPDTEIVTPKNTALLGDAFRNGFITTDDIMERLSKRTQKKKELDLAQTEQGLKDASDPELQAASRNVKLAQGATAKNVIDTADLAGQARENELKAAILDAQLKPGGYDAMQKALAAAGFPVAVTEGGVTEVDKQEIAKRYSKLLEYVQQRTDLKDKVDKTENHFVDVQNEGANGEVQKGQLQQLFHGGQKVDPGTYKQWVQQKEALDRTPFSLFYSLTKGTATPSAPGAQDVIQKQRREQFFPGVTTPEDSIVETPEPAPMIVPKGAPAPTAPESNLTPTGTIKPKSVQQTAEQQKELSQASFTSKQLNDVAQSFETLATNQPNLTGPVLGRLMSWTQPQNWNKDYASFDRAKTAILANLAKGIYHETGVLSDKDIERYGRAMPSVNDTPEVARAKLQGVAKDIFQSINSNIETMKGQGQNVTPIVEKMQSDAQAELAKLGGAPAAAQNSESKVINGVTWTRTIGPDGREQWFKK